jgi:hypothetical protein
MKDQVEVTVFDRSCNTIPSKARVLIRYLKWQINRIPAEFIGSAFVEFYACGTYMDDECAIRLKYRRPPTLEEMAYKGIQDYHERLRKIEQLNKLKQELGME